MAFCFMLRLYPYPARGLQAAPCLYLLAIPEPQSPIPVSRPESRISAKLSINNRRLESQAVCFRHLYLYNTKKHAEQFAAASDTELLLHSRVVFAYDELSCSFSAVFYMRRVTSSHSGL